MEVARGSPAWPRLDTEGWQETARALHLWMQVVGKTRLALCAPMNHWWHVPLYLTARGLTTGPIPMGHRAFDVEFDFIAHRLVVRSSDGRFDQLALGMHSVAEFFERYTTMLAKLGFIVELTPRAVEIADDILLDEDRLLRRYDADWATRHWQVLLDTDRLMKEFRGRFYGKASPVHFFWGSFDLATSRFSGRRAPPHPGGVPHLSLRVPREAYSHEVSSAGFWPGDASFPEAIFYSYAYPEPPGFKDARVFPEAARYDAALREFVLPYEALRRSKTPEYDLMAFFESTYEAAANLGGWDRSALERLSIEERPELEHAPR